MDPDFSAADGFHLGDRPVVDDPGLATSKTLVAATCFQHIVGDKHSPLRSSAKMEHVECLFRLGGNIDNLNAGSDSNSSFQEESLRQDQVMAKTMVTGLK